MSRNLIVSLNTTMKNMKLASYRIAVSCLVLVGVNDMPAADLYVPADYANIQTAVDAAVSGDTIHIAPGVYVEQVRIIKKNLTLIGQPGAILRAFPNMERPFPTVNWGRTILLVNGTEHVTIRGLTFEGEQLAGDQFDPLTGQYAPGLTGVWIDVSGGSVEDCRFTGFREKTPGSTYGEAVYFWNGFDQAARYEASVRNNTIMDSYTGIAITGANDVTSYDVTVVGNTVSGVGPNSTDAYMVGISLQGGIAGEVVRNTISGFSYNGDGATRESTFAFGILGLTGFPDNIVPVGPFRFEDNVLRDNQVHMTLIRGDNSVIQSNTFEGAAPGVRPVGLWFTGQNVQVSGNAFHDMPEGVRIGGEDPDYGTLLGIAVNAQLTDNRFCNVTNSINIQPQATATETGTLTCPFPDPVLEISWPGIEEGFSVQSAPAPTGPWNTLDATPVRQNGQNTVVVPADRDQQFYRLAKP